MTIKKVDLIREVAKITGVTKRETGIIVNAFIECISKTLVNDERIELRGFGIFLNKKRKPKIARNPRTGERIELGERLAPVFKPSKLLKKKVAEK